MKKKKRVVNAGLSLIILIFTVGSLTIFAALAMTSAQADLRLSEKLAKRTSDYYETSNQANEILDQIDAFLAANYEKGLGKKEYNEVLSQLPTAIETAKIKIDQKNVFWELPLDQNQVLSVGIKVRYPDEKEKTFYKIIEWKVISKAKWEKEDKIPVYQKDRLPVLEKEK